MNKLYSVMAYFCSEYPHKHELSKARLTKLVYLADWFSALLDGNQMTNIKWIFNHYGPYVDDVYNLAGENTDFKTIIEETFYGDKKVRISYIGKNSNVNLSKREISILHAIIDKTKEMNFNDFISYVYSTYPVSSNERYSYLNLVELSKQYNEKYPEKSV